MHLNTYYSYQVFREDFPIEKLAKCDALHHPADFSRYLYLLSEHLRSRPNLLRILLKADEDFRAFVFAPFVPDPRVKAIILKYHQSRSERPQFRERRAVMRSICIAIGYRARAQWTHLLAPIWDFCIRIGRPRDNVFDKAFSNVITHTNSLDAYVTSGSATMEHLMLKYQSETAFEWIEYFIRFGGITSILFCLVSD